MTVLTIVTHAAMHITTNSKVIWLTPISTEADVTPLAEAFLSFFTGVEFAHILQIN